MLTLRGAEWLHHGQRSAKIQVYQLIENVSSKKRHPHTQSLDCK